MKCDIIIPVWNQLDCTKNCIDYIQRNTNVPYRLILVDNASEDETRVYLEGVARTSGNITLLRNEENLGFIKAVNRGLEISDSPYVCIMNNDTVPTDGWLSKMINLAERHPNIGLVNPRCESPGRLSMDEYGKSLERNAGQYLETNQCLGFCMLVKREVIDKIGHLDEIYGVGGFDDTEFSIKAYKAGFRCVSASDSYVYHSWHTSFKKAGNRESIVRQNEKIFFDRWGKYLRIAYPMTGDSEQSFLSDICTSLALAREWNWVHAWLRTDDNLKERAKTLPRHQSLRLFCLNNRAPIFTATVLFKLIERSLKRKKRYDAVIVSDARLFNTLSRFKKLFTTPLFYIGRDKLPIDIKDENSWTKRANFVMDMIKEVQPQNKGESRT